MKSHYRGFSLLELLIALGITAVLASLAIPAFANSLKRSNQLTITYQMIGLVQFARTQAISKSVPVTLCGSGDGVQCNNDWSKTILVFSDRNGDGVVNNDDVVLQTTTALKPGESMLWRSFQNKPYLQLQPNGMTHYQNGNFTYCPADGDAHFAQHWILTASGRLRIALDKNANGIPDKANGQDINC